jgi:hypothetical protein
MAAQQWFDHTGPTRKFYHFAIPPNLARPPCPGARAPGGLHPALRPRGRRGGGRPPRQHRRVGADALKQSFRRALLYFV